MESKQKIANGPLFFFVVVARYATHLFYLLLVDAILIK